jgi:hypothetical protein
LKNDFNTNDQKSFFWPKKADFSIDQNITEGLSINDITQFLMIFALYFMFIPYLKTFNSYIRNTFRSPEKIDTSQTESDVFAFSRPKWKIRQRVKYVSICHNLSGIRQESKCIWVYWGKWQIEPLKFNIGQRSLWQSGLNPSETFLPLFRPDELSNVPLG